MQQPLIISTTLIELRSGTADRLIAVRLSVAIGQESDTAPQDPAWIAAGTMPLLPWKWLDPVTGQQGTNYAWQVMARNAAGQWRTLIPGTDFAMLAPPALNGPDGAPIAAGPQTYLEKLWQTTPPYLGRVLLRAPQQPGGAPGPIVGDRAAPHSNGHSLLTNLESLATQPGPVALVLQLVGLLSIKGGSVADGEVLAAVPAFMMPLDTLLTFTPGAVIRDLPLQQGAAANQGRVAWDYSVTPAGAATPPATALVRTVALRPDLDSQWRVLAADAATVDWEPLLPDLAAAGLDLPVLLHAANADSSSATVKLIIAAWAGSGIDVGPTDDLPDARAKAALVPPALRLLRYGLGRAGTQSAYPPQRPIPGITALSSTNLSERSETLLAALGPYWLAQGADKYATFGASDIDKQINSDFLSAEDTARRMIAIWKDALAWAAGGQTLTAPIRYWTGLDRAVAAGRPTFSIVRGLIDLSIAGRRPTPADLTPPPGTNEAPWWVLTLKIDFSADNSFDVGLPRPDLPGLTIPLGTLGCTGGVISWTSPPGPSIQQAGMSCFLTLAFSWDYGSPAYRYTATLAPVSPGLQPVSTAAAPFPAGAPVGRGHMIELAAAVQPAPVTITLVRAVTTGLAVEGTFPPQNVQTLVSSQPRRLLGRTNVARALRRAVTRLALPGRANAPTGKDYSDELAAELPALLQSLCGVAGDPALPPLAEMMTARAFAPYAASSGAAAAISASADSPPILLTAWQAPGGAQTASEMIGLGVLALRQPGDRNPVSTGQSPVWRSLNAATASWPVPNADPALLIVDPAPLRGSSVTGLATTTIRYDGKPLIGAQSSDSAAASGIILQSPVVANLAAKKSHLPAPVPMVPLPRFGESLKFAAYAIGPGGVLPVELRSDPSTPYKMKPNPVPDPGSVIGTAYLRTVPLASPRIDVTSPAIPAAPSGFYPLAGELRDRPTPWLLAAGGKTGQSPVQFYCTRDGALGTLQIAPGGTMPISIDLLGITWAGPASNGFSFTVELIPLGPVPAGLNPSALRVTVNAGAGNLSWGNGLILTLPLTGQSQRLDLRLKIEAGTITAIPLGDVDSLLYPPSVPAGVSTPLGAPPILAGPYMVRLGVPPANQVDLLFEPPAVSLDGKPVACPQATHPKPGLLIFNYPNRQNQQILVRPPAVSFATWSRWRAADSWQLPPEIDAVRTVLNLDDKTVADKSLDDPAITGFVLELIQRFPDNPGDVPVSQCYVSLPPARPGPLSMAQAQPLQLIIGKGNAGITPDSAHSALCAVTVPEGAVYELRIYPAAKLDWFLAPSGSTQPVRFAASLLSGARILNPPGVTGAYVLGTPLRHLVEVATTSMPANNGVALKLTPTVTPALALQGTLAIADGFEALRQRLAYVLTATPFLQRWTWPGTPIPPPDNNVKWTEIAYLGRDPLDALALPPVRLRRGHLPPRPGTTGKAATILFERATPQIQGAGHWRASIRLQSRYEALGLTPMAEPQTSFDILDAAILIPSGTQAAIKTDGSLPPLPALVRPPLDLALPLTVGLGESRDLPPPLLLMFDGPLFQDGDLTDRIEIGLDSVRHPLPAGSGANSGDEPRYWPQVAPDPRLTGQAHDGSPLAMRMLGPVGWTQDGEAERPIYTRSSALLSFLEKPQGWDAGATWPMLKIRTRRFQDPEVKVGLPVTTVSPVTWPCNPQVSVQPVSGVGCVFSTQMTDSAELILLPAMTDGSMAPRVWRLKAVRSGARLTVTVSEILLGKPPNPEADSGRSRPLVLTLEGQDQTDPISLRVIVGRSTPSAAKSSPAWDISVAVQRPSDYARAEKDGSAGWIALPIMILDAAPADASHCSDQLQVAKASAGWSWSPIRLSACTEGVWVQFTADASTIQVKPPANDGIQHGCEEFSASIAAGKITLWLDGASGAAGLRPRSLSGPSAPATLYALATANVTDAGGQPAERALGVFPIGDALDASQGWAVQSGTVDLGAIGSHGGRIRFLSIEERPNRAPPDSSLDPAFAPVTRLFKPGADDATSVDAPGRIIAISPSLDIPADPNQS